MDRQVRHLRQGAKFVLELEDHGARLFYLASDLAKAGVRAGTICQVLAMVWNLLYLAASLRHPTAFGGPLRSHSSDRPDPITAPVAEKGGGAVSPSDTS